MLLISLPLVACIRWRGRRRRTSPRDGIPLDRLPDSCTLSGVPLRILLSDRSGPGPLLRDMLHVRPDPSADSRPRGGSHPPDSARRLASTTLPVELLALAP